MKENFFNSGHEDVFEFIEKNKAEFEKYWEDKFQLIYDYPCLLSYPKYLVEAPLKCECCDQYIYNKKEKMKTWKDGYRPNIKQFYIELRTIATYFKLSKKLDITNPAKQSAIDITDAVRKMLNA